MKHSHPDRWLYGGILIRSAWTGEAHDVEAMNATIERLEPGDIALWLRTAGSIQLVAVLERAPREIVA